MAMAWHSVTSHAQSGVIVGTRGIGTQQGPSGQPERGKQGPGREGDAPTACLAEPRLTRCSGSEFSPSLPAGAEILCSPASPGRSQPLALSPPTAPRGSVSSPSNAGPSTLSPVPEAVGHRSQSLRPSSPAQPAAAQSPC